MKDKLKRYAKAGMGIYTLILIIYLIIVSIMLMYVVQSEATTSSWLDWGYELSCKLDYVASFWYFIVLPYICIWATLGTFYFIKWFIVEPLKHE